MRGDGLFVGGIEEVLSSRPKHRGAALVPSRAGPTTGMARYGLDDGQTMDIHLRLPVTRWVTPCDPVFDGVGLAHINLRGRGHLNWLTASERRRDRKCSRCFPCTPSGNRRSRCEGINVVADDFTEVVHAERLCGDRTRDQERSDRAADVGEAVEGRRRVRALLIEPNDLA
jgi:hypothetical protein